MISITAAGTTEASTAPQAFGHPSPTRQAHDATTLLKAILERIISQRLNWASLRSALMRTVYSVLALASFALLGPVTRADEAKPAPASQAKVFVVKTTDPAQDFVCPTGHIASVLAQVADGRGNLPIVLLTDDRKPIVEDTWAAASGFRLLRKYDAPVHITMICGP